MRTRRTEQAFTLVEVMVALVVLMIGMLGMISLVRTSFIASRASRTSNEAAVLAEQQLETLRTIPVVAGQNTTEIVDGRGLPSADGPYTRTTTVVTTTSGVLGTMLLVTVNLSWDEDGATRNVTLYTERLP